MQCLRRGPSGRAVLLLSAALASACTAVRAQEATLLDGPKADEDKLEFSLTAGAIESDNINRTPTDGEHGALSRAGILLDFAQSTRRLKAKVKTDAQYEHYLDGKFDDGVVGGGAADVRADLIPERLSWSVADNFGQVTVDPFGATTPDNRENINYFSTGPDVVFGAGAANSVRLSGRYSNTQYETTPDDSQQYSAMMALLHRLSGASQLSLNVRGDTTNFKDRGNDADYDRYQAYVRYEARIARTLLSADVGYTRLNQQDDNPSGELVRLSATHQLSPSSSLTIAAGTQFTSSGELFRNGQVTQGVSIDTSSVVGRSEPFRSRTGSVSYEFRRNRTGFGTEVLISKETYENVSSLLDRTLTDGSAYFSRKLTPALDMRVFGRFEREKFAETSFKDDEFEYGASLEWRFARTISLRLQYDRFDRNSTDNPTEYTENRASLFLTWSPTGRT